MMARRPPRQLATILSLIALVVSLAACGGDEEGAPVEPGVVEVDDNFFRPKTIDIVVGDTITWRWTGRASHNVVGPGFASKIQSEGTFEHTFDKAGDVQYVCTIHAGMTGKVRVAQS